MLHKNLVKKTVGNSSCKEPLKLFLFCVIEFESNLILVFLFSFHLEMCQ